MGVTSLRYTGTHIPQWDSNRGSKGGLNIIGRFLGVGRISKVCSAIVMGIRNNFIIGDWATVTN
jgi:hypothetical protein